MNHKYTALLKKSLVFLSVLFLFITCDKTSQIEQDIEATEVQVDVIRFDYAFAKASPENINDVKNQYPDFFPDRYDDAYWTQKLEDSIQMELREEVLKSFPVTSERIENDFESLFKRVSFYFPTKKIPKVYTVTSDVDYNNKIIWAGDKLLLALDTYLGSDHRFYDSFAAYQTALMRPEFMTVDAAHSFAQNIVATPRSYSLLNAMIYEGKKLYVMDKLLSDKSPELKFSYTADELAFAQENEVFIWQYFIMKELLYSTDRKLSQRFIDPAPFSKFYLELDSETPGRLGRYIGYQIVASYMKNNEISMDAMLLQDAQTLFKKSKYKP